VLGGKGIIGTLAAPVNVSLAGSALNPGDVDVANDAGNQPSLPGTLTINGNLTLTAAAKFNIDLTDTVSDKLVVNGDVTLGTSATLNLPSFTPASVHSYTLIDNLGANAISGAFSNYAEGATVTLGSANYTLTYAGGTGNDLVLEAPGGGGVPGDYNNNGTVDASDYVLWRKGGPLTNEIDNPGVVNAQDYVEWRARFGNSMGSGSSSLASSAAVPEPITAVLALFALAGSLAVRRHR
jgi:outer membrane autotransporter protein